MESWGADRYGSPCRECGFDWLLTPEDAIMWISRLSSLLDAAALPPDGLKRRGSGGWSVVEYVGHIGDNLRQWAERVQAVRLTGQPHVGGYDPDALAVARGYSALPLAAVVWSTSQAVGEWISVLRPALHEAIELDHAGRGRQRAEDVARNNCHDAFHHLWDIQQILQGDRP
ncbi:MAG: hypothetical protein QG671_2033 [Actinomycetota bacterium]|nr:hypothetical protein [Actinomycetota bacterium]